MSTETWRPERYKNGTLVSSFQITAATFGIQTVTSTSFAPGDKISMRCSGSSIDTPTIQAFFKEI